MPLNPDIAEVICDNYGDNVLSYLPLANGIDKSMPTHDRVLESWRTGHFRFIEETETVIGLRKPQVGGIYTALGHIRSDDNSPATIVMPTGTGKTETILSIVVAGHFKRTLVIVPSDALREQTANKFIKLGLLRELGLIDSTMLNPKVLIVKQGCNSIEDLKIVESANVIVATTSALSLYTESCLNHLVGLCSHLIVDEAHHVVARTWNQVKESFSNKIVFQFTATPFRADRKRVDGKIIFNYPITDAQKDGYFKSIEFHPVREFVDENADAEIAAKAVALLRKDLKEGYDHLLMARAGTIKKSEAIFQYYSKHKDLLPVLINSKTPNKAKILEDIKSAKHKIIVCVDMLGEGFDLPQLKIAALHDVHKSINITLQFTGRFTRQKHDLGNAKFVANIADIRVNEVLEELYNEDSDWNRVIKNIGTSKIAEEKSYQEFRAEFDTTASKLIDQGLNPKISTVVFSASKKNWRPQNFSNFADKNLKIVDSTLNKNKDVLIFSVKSYIPVSWSSSHELSDISWDLYIAYFDESSGLLFVHSSAKDGETKRLVKLIAKDAAKLSGEVMFRALYGLKRMCFQNVGLNRDRKDLRYIMYTGTDTKEAIPELEAHRARKSNIFAKGFENGQKATMGCSHKGKLWAMDSDSVDVWVSWCKNVGTKLLNDKINTNEIMKTAMQSEMIDVYPDLAVINVDWPDEILRKNEGRISIIANEDFNSLVNFELTVDSAASVGGSSMTIYLQSEKVRIPIVLKLQPNGEIEVNSKELVKIQIGDKEHNIDDYFEENPPMIFLVDTSTIEGGFRYYSNESYLFPYDRERIQTWPWDGVDISVESQKESKLTHSIQYHTIEQVSDNYDLIFDDDGSGEIADIVAIKSLDDEELLIDFYHCKYCAKKDGVAKPGSRVGDIYEVAGQAVKSVKWIHNDGKLFDRLILREKKRLTSGRASRIDKGDSSLLLQLRKISKLVKTKYRVFIVQPAISKKLASDELLSVIGSSEGYIKETTGVDLEVITSI